MRHSCGLLSPFYFLPMVVSLSTFYPLSLSLIYPLLPIQPVGDNPTKREQSMAFAFKKLIAYQKSVDFADKITEQTGQFRRGFYFLADQLNRAAVSIARTSPKATVGSQNRTGKTSSVLPADPSRSAYPCWNCHCVESSSNRRCIRH